MTAGGSRADRPILGLAEPTDCPECGAHLSRLKHGLLCSECWWFERYPVLAGGQGRSSESVRETAYALALLVAGMALGFGVALIVGVL